MKSLLFLSLLIVGVLCQNDKNSKENADQESVKANQTLSKKERMFSFLQVMKFPNDVCAGSNSKNGTCYSSDECSSKGGTNSGTCANGFGVCCVFSLSCGQSSSENNTYLILGATTTPSPSVCTYSLCENNANICRIRLDFTSFVINGPITGNTRAIATVGGLITEGGAIGDCAVDTFTLSAPGNRASPIICGTNTGQHMYIDTAAGGCAKATFDFGAAAVSRSYEIKVTQYNCGDEFAGPSDCLQYHTADAGVGVIKSFNFNLDSTNAVGVTSTHLSNQLYSICIRRNVGKCAICYSPTVASTIVTVQNSFGLSVTAIAAIVSGEVDAMCSTDYLVIPNAVTIASVSLNAAGNVLGQSRICGRFFGAVTPNGIATQSNTICSSQRPFKIVFNTDVNERQEIAGASMANVNEESGVPGGITGFSLDYFQLAC